MPRLIEALKTFGSKITTKNAALDGGTVEEVITNIAKNYSVVLKSPDGSLWDVSIENDGTISGVKRT